MTEEQDQENPTVNGEGTPESGKYGEDGVGASVSKYLLYTLSLPERSVRSVVALTAGAVKETSELLVPQAFQSSKTWTVVVRNSLDFLIRDVGGTTSDEPRLTPDDYVARKAVGNFIDITSIALFHMSPLWILAVVSDVAYGTKTYLAEVAEELAEKGIIDKDSTIHNVDDVLEAIQKGSGSASTIFDIAPLSIDELKETLNQTRAAMASADVTKVLPASEIKKIWNDMHEIAAKENVSLLEVSGAVTMSTFEKLGNVTHGALTGMSVAGGLFNRHILGHYADATARIHSQGYYATLQECSAPYLTAVADNFSLETDTITEKVASGRLLSRVISWIRRKLRR